MFQKNAQALLDFIEKSPCNYQVIETMKKDLEAAGFQRLQEQNPWKLQPGGAYYVTRNDSSLIAFRMPENRSFRGFQIIASHSDSPSLRVKENPALGSEGCYTRLNTEKYGGMILSTWLDRPLSVAGRLVVRETRDGQTTLRTVPVHVDRDLVLIPSLAIHMNREANQGYTFNPQTDLLPLFGSDGAKSALPAILAEAAGVSSEAVVSSDLFVYNRQKGTIWGADCEYLSSPRLDDLECAYGSLRGILAAGRSAHEEDLPTSRSENVCVHCVLDNEEVGSGSRQGAASTFLKDTLRRISQESASEDADAWREEDYLRQVAGSFLISADNAHAVHPNKGEKADPVNRPRMNEGVVVKFSGNQSYTSDGLSAAVLRCLCEKADVPVQVFTNRSDAPGGSTLGNISTAQVPVCSVDIGLPQLAMHSAYETAGVKDITWLIRLAETFFTSTVEVTADGRLSIR